MGSELGVLSDPGCCPDPRITGSLFSSFLAFLHNFLSRVFQTVDAFVTSCRLVRSCCCITDSSGWKRQSFKIIKTNHKSCKSKLLYRQKAVNIKNSYWALLLLLMCF